MALTAAKSAELDTGALIERLARPAPARIEFAEVRFSPLLQQPLIVAGELQYLGPSNLERQVNHPYREQTLIRGDSVRVSRDGEPVRSFALKRAAELSGLLTGFTALLAGDRVALEHDFRLATSGDEHAWKLTLIPISPRTRNRLQRIEVHGRDNEPSCFTLHSANGGASILLLGETAREAISEQATREELTQRCEQGG